VGVVVGNQALQRVWLPSGALTIAIFPLLGAIGNRGLRWPTDRSMFTYPNGGRDTGVLDTHHIATIAHAV